MIQQTPATTYAYQTPPEVTDTKLFHLHVTAVGKEGKRKPGFKR